MERNKNIDIVRALAILLILVYHIYALSHVPLMKGNLNSFIEYGGEYGVVVFFMLSGFSIYKSLSRRKDNFNYGTFIKDRLKRILPQYYISLLILLFYTGNSILLFSSSSNCNLFSHLFLLHGFYPTAQGAISGVAWTLTPFLCFYLISPLLYKAIEEKPKLMLVFSIIFSCAFKFVIYNVFEYSVNPQGFGMYFIFGKSIFGVIDEFVIGMFLAKYINSPKDNKKIVLNIILVILSLVGLYFWIYVEKNGIRIITENTNRFSNCFEAYIWYSVLSIILAVGIYGFSQIKIGYENPISKFLLCISKHEYGIYLWHLEFIRIVCQVNPYIQELMTANRRIVYLYLGFSAMFIGILMSVVIDGVDWQKVYEEFKVYIKVLAYVFWAVIGIILIKSMISLIVSFTSGLPFEEYIFMFLYAIGVEAFILYLINRRNNRNSKKILCLAGVGFGLACIWKGFFQDLSNIHFELHLNYIVQMFQSMSARFYESIPHMALLGLLLLGLVMKFGNSHENTRKFVTFNIVAMHITFLVIVLNYLLFLGEGAMAANNFIEYYSGIFIMQLITIFVLFVPNFLYTFHSRIEKHCKLSK